MAVQLFKVSCVQPPQYMSYMLFMSNKPVLSSWKVNLKASVAFLYKIGNRGTGFCSTCVSKLLTLQTLSKKVLPRRSAVTRKHPVKATTSLKCGNENVDVPTCSNDSQSEVSAQMSFFTDPSRFGKQDTTLCLEPGPWEGLHVGSQVLTRCQTVERCWKRKSSLKSRHAKLQLSSECFA